MSYDIFLNLEVAGGQELVRSDATSERFGLIPQAANPRTNPDALPIGLTKTVMTEGRWKGLGAAMTPHFPVHHGRARQNNNVWTGLFVQLSRRFS